MFCWEWPSARFWFRGGRAGTSLGARLARVGLLDLVLSSAIEAGQLFIPARTASVFDVVAQVMGSLVGVRAAHAWLRTRRAAVRPCLLPLLQREPAVAALGIMIAVQTMSCWRVPGPSWASRSYPL